MTTLFLSRHGETEWHAENRYAGRSDVGMTPRGYEQAEHLGEWAARAELDAVCSSTLSRSVLTATPATKATGLPLTKDPRLVEVDFGRGDGLTRAEMRERFPVELEAFLGAPGTVPLPEGEPGADAVARCAPALDDLCAQHPDGRVLVVMHSTLMRLLLCHLLGLDLDRYRALFPGVTNAALTAFRLTPGVDPQLIAFNVPPDTRTRLG
ncbi:histidine phosphatase family protein [Paramicrobacterium agarici]|uniref:histidine phosphatase family protein n=1 Tax=Paramicrobacterium agarici TaxID=630514 RepID=UPI00115062A5|nr:histidine phosphatase family protein [Microbacterium agarici]TQO22930.1 putative phosphoglycerate mutase [Microbacterium agarici]